MKMNKKLYISPACRYAALDAAEQVLTVSTDFTPEKDDKDDDPWAVREDHGFHMSGDNSLWDNEW